MRRYGQAGEPRSLPETEAKAVAKNLGISPQKLNSSPGSSAARRWTRRSPTSSSRGRIASDVRKCVMSAVANAENNHGLDVNEPVVAEATSARTSS